MSPTPTPITTTIATTVLSSSMTTSPRNTSMTSEAAPVSSLPAKTRVPGVVVSVFAGALAAVLALRRKS